MVITATMPAQPRMPAHCRCGARREKLLYYNPAYPLCSIMPSMPTSMPASRRPTTPRNPTPEHYLSATLNARVYDIARETSLDRARLLSDRLGNDIRLKREDQQPIFCYKIRGAYNKMRSLSPQQLKRGVVAASAGNHAQGVAMCASHLNCKAIIVMPVTASAIKLEAVRRWGARVELVGDNYDDACDYARKLCRRHNLLFIHPFDDPAVIAGQGTVGQEILKQHSRPLEAVFLPVGGGGLIAGVSAYIKQVRPEVRIIGVEPFESDAMHRSLQAGRRLRLKQVGIFADGVAIAQVGRENFKLCRLFVDEVVRVTTDEICAAVKDICEDTRTIVEPSGALAVAGIKRWLRDEGRGGRPPKNKNLVAVISGANMSFDRLRHISERAEIGERREAILAVTIPEKVGSFRKFCHAIGNRSVSEFNYRYAGGARAQVFVGLQISRSGEVEMLVRRLKHKGFDALDLTDNEIAKIHARHMVGGRAPQLTDERVFSFEFPERPGALRDFLDKIGVTWSITLFHYRNHGSDFGRVLCGIRVPAPDRGKFSKSLRELGYRYSEQTDNPVYRLFLL